MLKKLNDDKISLGESHGHALCTEVALVTLPFYMIMNKAKTTPKTL